MTPSECLDRRRVSLKQRFSLSTTSSCYPTMDWRADQVHHPVRGNRTPELTGEQCGNASKCTANSPLPGSFSTVHPLLYGARQTAWENKCSPQGCNGLVTCDQNKATVVLHGRCGRDSSGEYCGDIGCMCIRHRRCPGSGVPGVHPIPFCPHMARSWSSPSFWQKPGWL